MDCLKSGSVEFLTERQVAEAVTELVGNASDVRLAVAFWGKEARAMLGGLSGSGPTRARVICNLDSGACNPDELLDLRKHVLLRSHPQLHAKVYWTPAAVIVGSSNASTNGLWGEGKESRGWREANLLVRSPDVVERVGDWFESQWLEAFEVTPAAIKRSRPLWLVGKKGAPTGSPLPRSLFEAFRAHPYHPAWKRVKVALVKKGLTRKGKAELKVEMGQDHALSDARAYEGWWGRFDAGDWIIEMDARQHPASVCVYSIGDTPIVSETLVYAWAKSKIDLAPFGLMKLTPSETATFQKLAGPGSEVIASLDGYDEGLLSLVSVLRSLMPTG